VNGAFGSFGQRRARPTFRPPAQAANERREAIAVAQDAIRAILDWMQQANLNSAIQHGVVPAGTRLPSPRLYAPSTTRLGQRHYKVTIPYKLYYVDLDGQIKTLRDSDTGEVRNGQLVNPYAGSAAFGGGEYAGPGTALAVGTAGVGLLLLGPLVIILKGFKPKWSYGRRVAVGMGVSMAIGAATQIARGRRQ
jgi:hypothetical protein